MIANAANCTPQPMLAKKQNPSNQSQSPPSPPQMYRGRFAPSPTGPLHFGSLVAAVASYLEAKTQQGIWLVRIEDLDPPREVSGAIDSILRSLEKHGLFWDESIIYQSHRHEIYHAAIETLRHQDLVYPCYCSRKDISEQQQRMGLSIYPGTCRDTALQAVRQHSIRVKTQSMEISFDDKILGHFSHDVADVVGDFVLKRSDGWFAYQLSVVVDDAEQGITDVVRGADLLDNTPRQIYLQRLLGAPQPSYAHIPIAANLAGEKLSKQTFAPAIDDTLAAHNLIQALEYLGHKPPTELITEHLDTIWQWAIKHWKLDNIPKVPHLRLDV